MKSAPPVGKFLGADCAQAIGKLGDSLSVDLYSHGLQAPHSIVKVRSAVVQIHHVVIEPCSSLERLRTDVTQKCCHLRMESLVVSQGCLPHKTHATLFAEEAFDPSVCSQVPSKSTA